MDLPDSFQTKRVSDRFQAVLQVVLVFLILAAINHIGMRRYERIDLSDGRQYALSPETKAYLATLDRPIEAIVTISSTADEPGMPDVLKDVKGLLREYEYATREQGENRVTVEYLNVYSQTSRARALGIDSPNVVVFKSGGRQRQVGIEQLYTLQDQQIREFKGENVFTRSILEIVETSDPVIYFTSGHGELSAENVSAAGASELFNALKARNLATRYLDLTTVEAVPKDASLVIVAAPKTRFLPQEELILTNYLNQRAGRVLTLLEPGQAHGLDNLFFAWGILAEDVLLVERDPNFVINGGDLMIRRPAQHPITNSLFQQQISVITDRATSVRADPGRPLDDSLAVTELLASSDRSWGERRYRAETAPSYDPAIDLAPPIKLAAIAERRVDSSLGVTLPGGKLIVLGTANFATNQRIRDSGNLFLLLNAINYSLDRDSRLNIPPRPIRKVKLDLSLEQLHLARYLIWFAPPTLLGLLGLLVYISRRS